MASSAGDLFVGIHADSSALDAALKQVPTMATAAGTAGGSAFSNGFKRSFGNISGNMGKAMGANLAAGMTSSAAAVIDGDVSIAKAIQNLLMSIHPLFAAAGSLFEATLGKAFGLGDAKKEAERLAKNIAAMDKERKSKQSDAKEEAAIRAQMAAVDAQSSRDGYASARVKLAAALKQEEAIQEIAASEARLGEITEKERDRTIANSKLRMQLAKKEFELDARNITEKNDLDQKAYEEKMAAETEAQAQAKKALTNELATKRALAAGDEKGAAAIRLTAAFEERHEKERAIREKKAVGEIGKEEEARLLENAALESEIAQQEYDDDIARINAAAAEDGKRRAEAAMDAAKQAEEDFASFAVGQADTALGGFKYDAFPPDMQKTIQLRIAKAVEKLAKEPVGATAGGVF